eukprot:scaffold626_cov409-Prasinococcus_capsulatus_cf.AAC.13
MEPCCKLSFRRGGLSASVLRQRASASPIQAYRDQRAIMHTLRACIYMAFNVCAVCSIIFANKSVFAIYQFTFRKCAPSRLVGVSRASMLRSSPAAVFMPILTGPACRCASQSLCFDLLPHRNDCYWHEVHEKMWHVRVPCLDNGTEGALGIRLCPLRRAIQPKPEEQHRMWPRAQIFLTPARQHQYFSAESVVGFFQITKILITPVVLVFEMIFLGKKQSWKVKLSIVVELPWLQFTTCPSTCWACAWQLAPFSPLRCISFGQEASNESSPSTQIRYGVLPGESCIISSMTRCVGWSTQLLDQFSPVAAGMLAVCIPILEPLGLGAGGETRSTLLGYNMTFGAALAIAISSVLGLLVNYSTFLVIGETSSLTYNVVGHIKTVIILVGGVLLFGDDMEFRKALGVGVTIVGMGTNAFNRNRPVLQAFETDCSVGSQFGTLV